MVKMKFRSDYRRLDRRVNQVRSHLRNINPEKSASESAHYFHARLIENLETQGRGGESPDLSTATRQIYKLDGEPDGSGIRNHIQVSVSKRGKAWVGSVNIPPGKPTLVAAVQESGATIPVTEKMRGFLALRGIYLKSSTNYIYVPGRRFWSKAKTDTKRFTRGRLRKNVLR
jgi:hypothetical protein